MINSPQVVIFSDRFQNGLYISKISAISDTNSLAINDTLSTIYKERTDVEAVMTKEILSNDDDDVVMCILSQQEFDEINESTQKDKIDPHLSDPFQIEFKKDLKISEILMSHNLSIIVAYLPSWITYKEPPRNPFSYLNEISKLSHLIYCFADLDTKTGSVTFETDSYANYESIISDKNDVIYGNIQALKRIKEMYPTLKIGFSIGGYDFSKKYSKILRNAGRRMQIVNSIKKLLVEDNPFFDFVDIDWESMDSSIDALYFSEILLMLKIALKGTEKNITMAVPAHIGAKIKEGKGFPHQQILNNCVDLFFLMAFDYVGYWSELSGHHSPLSLVRESLRSTMEVLNRKKIVLGLPAYGRAFYNCTGLGKPYANCIPDTEEGYFSSEDEKEDWSYSEYRGKDWFYSKCGPTQIKYENNGDMNDQDFERLELEYSELASRVLKLLNISAGRKCPEKENLYFQKTISYSEIVELILKNAHLIVEAQFTDDSYVLMKNSTKTAIPSLLITYNSQLDIINKIQLVKEMGIGGVFIWEISNDYKEEENSIFSLFPIKF